MKYQGNDEYAPSGTAASTPCIYLVSSQERLNRWASLLERDPVRLLHTIHGTEFALPWARSRLREEDSPISVAFADPALRAAGMIDDTYGEAKRFFSLKDPDLHAIVCYCHFGASLSAAAAARQVRGVAARLGAVGVVGRLRALFH